MRSDKVHRAMARNLNRFEVCQLVSKGVRATHKLGSRFEDTINSALDHVGHDSRVGPASDHDKIAAKSIEPAA